MNYYSLLLLIVITAGCISPNDPAKTTTLETTSTLKTIMTTSTNLGVNTPTTIKHKETSTTIRKEVVKMDIKSRAFEDGGMIPRKYTCQGDDINPPLEISGVPEGCETLVIIVDDPDAPSGNWDHWIVWNIPADTTVIPEDTVPAGSTQGMNDFRRQSYGGPCPPSGTHRYYFRLYALDSKLGLTKESRKKDVLTAIGGHVLAESELMGNYKKE
ncbi:MAG: YbhB/YbcL family Raf kinase inhibitor-like protein [Candidatus Altiarchaeota archaeon]